MQLMPGKRTIDAIFKWRKILKNYDMTGRKICEIFVDLEKALDRVSREMAWWALTRKVVVIMKMYKLLKH